MSTATEIAPRGRRERTENADRRRRQLVEATLRSIVGNGLAATTLATVAREAGLSQGVAVFYYRTKEALLAAALEAHYQDYHDNWCAALRAAGDDPVSRLAALIRSDFDPAVANGAALAIWHAFWGEARARPGYAEIAARFDAPRAAAIRRACLDLVPEPGRAETLADGIECLTDGLWLKMYLDPAAMDADGALALVSRHLALLLPEHGEALADAMRNMNEPREDAGR